MNLILLDSLRRMKGVGDLKFCLRVTLLGFQRDRERVLVYFFSEGGGVDYRETVCRGGDYDAFGDDCAEVYGTFEGGVDEGTSLGWTQYECSEHDDSTSIAYSIGL